jgi:altronate dehydratase
VNPARAIVLDPADDVATALADLSAGSMVALSGAIDGEIAVMEKIRFGHKIALRAIEPGEVLRKYGEVIGRATARIQPGAHVHRRNLEGDRGR